MKEFHCAVQSAILNREQISAYEYLSVKVGGEFGAISRKRMPLGK